ncbi:efflux RND transporter permease subunit [Escherichia coli]
MNSGMMFITLKPRDERSETAQQIIDRLRVKLAKEPGANLFLMAVQERQSNASYQYTLLSDDLAAPPTGAEIRKTRRCRKWRSNSINDAGDDLVIT